MAERAVSKMALRISKREERRLERAVVREGMVLGGRDRCGEDCSVQCFM